MSALQTSKLGTSEGFDLALAGLSPAALERLAADGSISTRAAFAHLMAGMSQGDPEEAYEAWIEADKGRGATAVDCSLGHRLQAKRALRGE
jgi:hypothetical protein